jgi:hypothetical protein
VLVASDLPTPESVQADLVDALTYEDDQWLWEPVWVLNAHYPDFPVVDKVGLVRRVVLGLANQGRLTLWKGDWTTGAAVPLSDPDRLRIEVEDAPWHDPQETDLAVVIRITSQLT